MLLGNYFVEIVLNALKMKGYNKTLRSLPVLKTLPHYSIPKSMQHYRNTLYLNQCPHLENHTICTTGVYHNVCILPPPPYYHGIIIIISVQSPELKCLSYPSLHCTLGTLLVRAITREQVHQQSSSEDHHKRASASAVVISRWQECQPSQVDQ